jgi:uncharacterized sulfatase
MDERYDMIRMARDQRFLYIRNYCPWKPYNQYLDYAEEGPIRKELRRLLEKKALLSGAHWFEAKRKPVEELYDCQADPDNMHNLADKADYAEPLARLRAAHEKWMTDTRDLGLLPEPELNRLGRVYGNRYAIYAAMESEEPGFWSSLRTLAIRAGAPLSDDAPALLEAVKSDHPAMRRWAVEGIVNLGASSDVIHRALRLAMADDAATVRVAAAAALARDEADRMDALHSLQVALAREDEWIRVQAATALDELGELARPALEALQKAVEDRENKYVARVAIHAVNALTGSNNRVM